MRRAVFSVAVGGATAYALGGWLGRPEVGGAPGILLSAILGIVAGVLVAAPGRDR